MNKKLDIPIKPANSRFNDEQWEAIYTKGNNILVAASAGSGKTTVLIERIYQHIAQGYADIDELLVVTFTNAAAKEMKERMEVRLKQAISETNGEERLHFTRQLKLLPEANISTLHSFCLQVVQEYFYLIDIDPNFTLMTDNTQIQLLYEEVWDELVADIVENIDEGDGKLNVYLDLLSRYSSARSDDGLYDLVLDINNFASSHPNSNYWLDNINYASSNFDNFSTSDLYKNTLKPFFENNLKANCKLIEAALYNLESLQADTIEKYEPVLRDDLDNYQTLLNNTDNLETFLDVANNFKRSTWPSNRKTNEDYEEINVLKALRDQASDNYKNITNKFTYSLDSYKEIEKENAEILEAVAKLTHAFRKKLKAKKEEQKVLEYNDLEHLTLEILAPYQADTNERVPSVAAKAYQDKFVELLIDEYQDINEIQDQILHYLSKNAVSCEVGNQFMVGDVKQSIYGFRLAEPGLFLEKYSSYAEGSKEGYLINLDRNYRSRHEILHFTNYIFERIMDIDFGQMNYGQQEALKVGHEGMFTKLKDEKYNIQLLLHTKEVAEDVESSQTLNLDSKEEAQAHIIAQDIQSRILRNEVIEDKSGNIRPIRYSDFVILSSTKRPFTDVQKVFDEYQIPINTQDVETYFKRYEIQLMLALLKIIDNPRQDLPFVAILRSYFVQITDEELSWIRIKQPRDNFYIATEKYVKQILSNKRNYQDEEILLATKLNNFLEQLAKWRQYSYSHSIAELIWLIYQDTNYISYVIGLSNGSQRQANLHSLYERAAEYEKGNAKGLISFIQYIERTIERDNDLAEPNTLDADANFVRLMTVHASKGLEFPYVYIMGLERAFNLQDVSRNYIMSKNYGVGTKLLDYENMLSYDSLVRAAISIEKENSLKYEEMRKLYVAFTRAEYKLILVGTIDSSDRWQSEQEQIQQQLKGQNTIKVPVHSRQKARSWLNWITDALATPQIKSQSVADFSLEQVDISFISEEDIADTANSFELMSKTPISKKDWYEKIKIQLEKTKPKQENVKKVQKHMQSKYTYQLATNTASYQAVSELKRLYEEPRIEKLTSMYYSDRRKVKDTKEESLQGVRFTQDTFTPPKFVQDDKLTSLDKGNATHYLLQKVDFSKIKDLPISSYRAYLEDLLEVEVRKETISFEQGELIDLNSVTKFLESDLAQEIIQKGYNLKKEESFSYLLPASSLFKRQLEEFEIKELADDQLLIHGTIDAYYETDESIVLFDYKTDRYRKNNLSKDAQINNIVNNYRFQLSLYAKALEVAKNKPVKEAYLALLDFGEVVLVDDLYDV